jgi:AcrR family transcriptional regulator
MTTGPDPEDLTARARIRDAAVVHFGEHGFDRATIRGIAETAGVSSGLVRHHFGSKQALRAACDEHLSRTLRRLNERARTTVDNRLDDAAKGGSGFEDLNSVAMARAALGPYQQYLARALAEGSAEAVFDEMVRLGEEWLLVADRSRPDPPDVDARTRAALITAMALCVLVLQQQLSRTMGRDLSSPEADELLSRALIDIYSHPLISLEDAASARAALDRISSGSPRQTPEPRPAEARSAPDE